MTVRDGTVSGEMLAEMLAGLEGVTPGPWFEQGVTLEGDDIGSVYIVGANLGGLVAGAHAWPTEIDDGDFERVEANAAHIARCDPDTMRVILTELQARRSVPSEPVAWGVWLLDGRFMDIASDSRDDAIEMAEVHYETGEYVIRPLYPSPASKPEVTEAMVLIGDSGPHDNGPYYGGAGEVSVNPLVWVKSGLTERWTAQYPFGQFEVTLATYLTHEGPPYTWHRGICSENFNTLEDAQSAAQADYEQRILSALSVAP